MDDGQKTPRGHPDFNSYVKILRVLVFITDGQTEKLIRCGLGNLLVPPGKTPDLKYQTWATYSSYVGQVRVRVRVKVRVNTKKWKIFTY